MPRLLLVATLALLAWPCVATGEPPSRQVEEWLRHGRELFLDGRYLEARYELGRARDLHRANAGQRQPFADYFIARSLAAEGRCEEALAEIGALDRAHVPEGEHHRALAEDETRCRLVFGRQLAEAQRCAQSRETLAAIPAAVTLEQRVEQDAVLELCRPATSDPWVWVALGGGASLLALAGGMTALAVSADEEYDRQRAIHLGTEDSEVGERARRAADAAEIERTVAITVAATAAAAGLAGVIYATWRLATGPPGDTPGVVVTPAPRLGAGVLVTLSF